MSRMIRNRLRCSSKNKIFLCLIAIFIFYNESLIFYIQRLWWKQHVCETETCTKVLFVADPQILGNSDHDTMYKKVLDYFIVIDSDRQLANTYYHAFNFAKPDVVVFLGDIMNDGSISSDFQFNAYLKRFRKIFPYHEDMDVVIIPGDNDIGGEGSEQVKPSKIHRFRKTFGDRDIYKFNNNFNVYHINRITHELPLFNEEEKHEYDDNSNFVRIFVSHMPLLMMPGTFTKKALDRFKPHISFSGHEHRSLKIKSEPGHLRYSSASSFLVNNNYSVVDFDLKILRENSELLEISVPTCNYRMGFPNIGYSLGVFEEGYLYYSVLWLPFRFHQFRVYGFFFAFIIVLYILLLKQVRNMFRRFPFKDVMRRTKPKSFLPR